MRKALSGYYVKNILLSLNWSCSFNLRLYNIQACTYSKFSYKSVHFRYPSKLSNFHVEETVWPNDSIRRNKIAQTDSLTPKSIVLIKKLINKALGELKRLNIIYARIKSNSLNYVPNRHLIRIKRTLINIYQLAPRHKAVHSETGEVLLPKDGVYNMRRDKIVPRHFDREIRSE